MRIFFLVHPSMHYLEVQFYNSNPSKDFPNKKQSKKGQKKRPVHRPQPPKVAPEKITSNPCQLPVNPSITDFETGL